MIRRNPFRVVERIGRIAGYVGLGLLVACILAPMVVYSARDFGWWALLLIPGVPIGLLAVFFVAGLIAWGGDAIASRWRDARYRWDRKHNGG